MRLYKHRAIGMLLGLTLATTALAASETVITTTIYPDGSRQVDAKIVPREVPEALMSFAEADANGDGCVDAKEARDAGVLNIRPFAKTRKNCLSEAEYNEAVTAPTHAAN
ncbi:MAG TPA: hypothetical protein VNN09_07530 [Candidatus Competibacteraceae bacterium]|nr:hypothetical protein [Candidatus Competibacteraceae bacterium]